MHNIQIFTYYGSDVRTLEQDNDIWFVAKDVCDILGLANSREAISVLDDDEKMTVRNSDSHSGQRGGAQFINMINESGLYALVFRSNKPEAKAFSRWVRKEVLPQIRRTGSYSMTKEQPALPSGVIEGARIIFEATGIKDNQAALALDKIYRSYTGRSALNTGEILLEAPEKQQLLTPTEIAEHFGFAQPKTGARVINKILADAGYQRKVAGKYWEPSEAGACYCVMLDTNKKHSDGTPVRCLKWTSTIIPIIECLLA